MLQGDITNIKGSGGCAPTSWIYHLWKPPAKNPVYAPVFVLIWLRQLQITNECN